MRMNQVKKLKFFKDPGTGRLLTIIIPKGYRKGKYNFITPDNFSLQLGLNFYNPGEKAEPHFHAQIPRYIKKSQECVIVKKGELIVYIFNNKRKLIAQAKLYEGDMAFYVAGGHGFKFLKKTQIIELKQGPFLGEKDKVRFNHKNV